jgi:hypothetical protein
MVTKKLSFFELRIINLYVKNCLSEEPARRQAGNDAAIANYAVAPMSPCDCFAAIRRIAMTIKRLSLQQ